MPNPKRPAIHYIHRLDYSIQERLVGLFVLLALGVVFALFFVNSQTAHLFDDKFYLQAYLGNAGGISTKTPVKVSGIEVGRITAIDISADNRIHITLAIYERYHGLVRVDSRASIGKLSMLGNASIELTAGSHERPLMPDGALIQVEEPLSLDELMAELTPVLLGVKQIITSLSEVAAAMQPKRLDATLDDLASAADNLNALSQQLASGHGVAGALLYDTALEAQLRTLLDQVEAAITQGEARLVELQPTLANLARLSAKGDRLAGEVSPLVGDSRALVGDLRQAMGAVNLELHRLPELVSRVQRLLERSDALLEQAQGVWPLTPKAKPSPRQGLPLPRGE